MSIARKLMKPVALFASWLEGKLTPEEIEVQNQKTYEMSKLTKEKLDKIPGGIWMNENDSQYFEKNNSAYGGAASFWDGKKPKRESIWEASGMGDQSRFFGGDDRAPKPEADPEIQHEFGQPVAGHPLGSNDNE